MRQINLVCSEDRINTSKDLQVTFPSIKLNIHNLGRKKPKINLHKEFS